MTRVETIKLHSLKIDAHFDLLMDVSFQREKGRTKVIETDYWPRFIEGGVDAIIASVFLDSRFLPEMALRKALNQVSCLYEEAGESPDKLVICRNSEEMVAAKKQGKIGFLLSLEGAEPIGEDLTLLRVFFELGVRNLGLVWSRRNAVGDGSHFGPICEGKKGGITPFGVELIEEAQKLGMTIDVSHLNDEGFWDVMEISKKPFIASHSNARKLSPTLRNLTDEQIKAIASRGGVIGVNAVSTIVAEKDEDSHLEQLLHHIDHMVKLVGIDYVGIGLDLCNDFYKYISPEDLAKMPRKAFDVVDGHQNFMKVIEGLISRGYSDEDIEKIEGGNFLRIFT
ncbi:dipeptidase [Jeotgalibacillus soli]|uniref:Renal dipeptidase family protein n=1 Tax=Jeotgalibacillus soli TaxID=889306 RepID=A0A0C2VA24_9BACL|nr:dipeptidase [Jeotgalibacillus soli]KIL45817.1 renal dipeptidase family protein [Jeotgalibacillus soli]